jgi:hypothetical protein
VRVRLKSRVDAALGRERRRGTAREGKEVREGEGKGNKGRGRGRETKGGGEMDEEGGEGMGWGFIMIANEA